MGTSTGRTPGHLCGLDPVVTPASARSVVYGRSSGHCFRCRAGRRTPIGGPNGSGCGCRRGRDVLRLDVLVVPEHVVRVVPSLEVSQPREVMAVGRANPFL